VTPLAAFETLPVAALLVELDGTVLAANRIASQLAANVAGSSLFALAPDLAPRWPQLVEAARGGQRAVDELRVGGRVLQLVLGIADIDGKPIVQAIAVDVAAGAATRQRAEAEERLDSLGVVAGGIAHDFNNLLVGVLAEATAARESESLAPATHEALRRIEGAARRMAQLTRQLLAFSGRGELVLAPLDADALVGELREQLARTVRTDAALRVALGAPARVVEADAGLLRQVVLNLVRNASDAGAMHVDVRTSVGLHDGKPCWLLEVIDDGAGIEPAVLPRIFEPFFSTRTDRHGLGLSAVHGIVRRLGGDIDVESRPGQGARFCVRLPALAGVEPRPTRLSEMGMPALKLAGVRVLVADDEPSVRATVRRLLERRGAFVTLASDGLEAETRLRETRFDVVVLDVQMPGRTGHEVLVIARETQPDTPVVLMSGYTEKIRGQGSEEEADAFLEKPFSARALDATIDSVLR
jgi:signal transduction histidine kinase/CheY-like chemotaxis protein